MSDKEFGSNDDLSLPKATVAKILTEILPPNKPNSLTTSRDFRDALIDCCVEFITLIASEANEISEREAKKTIAVEHVTAALKDLDFGSYVAPVLASAADYKKTQDARAERNHKLNQKTDDGNPMTAEQLLAEQDRLFSEARGKFSTDGGPGD